MASSSEEVLHIGNPFINPALLYVPIGDPTLEITVADVQLSVGPQLEPQLSTSEVSTARFFMI